MAKKITELLYRAVGQPAASGRSPSTFDRETRSVGVVAATEDPVTMWDWDLGEIPEVLLMKGCQIPELRQIPLLDTHSRYSTSDVVGSARGLKTQGDALLADAVLSGTERGEHVLTLIEEGHLTDVSIGYRINDYTTVKKGEKAVIAGRSWTGPVRVVTSWTPRELSVCPIGADGNAKMRAESRPPQPTEADAMTLEELARAQEATQQAVAGLTQTLSGLVPALTAVAERAAAEQKIAGTEATVKQLRDEAVRAPELDRLRERGRIAEIDAMHEEMTRATGIDFTDIRTECIEKGYDEAQSRKRYMDRIKTATPKDTLGGQGIIVTADERDKSRAAAVDGLLLRTGMCLDQVKDPQSEFRGLTLFELARSRCLTFNQSVRGLSKLELFARAMSTSDFTNILADVANKGVLEGFESEPESYEVWVDTTGRVNDFKTHVFARASEAPSFQEVNPDGGEYKYAKMTDKKESVVVTDQGIIVPFTRAAMVNDDLGALADIREKLGVAAKRKYGDLVYAVLTGNPAMGDGNTLFDASNHKNVATSGDVAPPSVATLNAMATAMATQKDLQGLQNLNIMPQFLIHPWALKATVDELLHNTNPVVVGANTKNPWAYLTSVPEARLDASSAKYWYAAARKGKTVKLYTLDGQMAPVVETREGWVTDGIEFKGRITGAAKALDWAGLYQNPDT